MLAEAVVSSLSAFVPLLLLGAAAIALRLFWQGTADWRFVTGSTLLAVALAMVLSLLLANLPLRPQQPPTAATAPARHALPATPSQQRPAKQRPATTQKRTAATAIKIIALSNGRVSIQENGRIYTLHLGDKSPGGWRLVSASTLRAELIRPDGKHYIYRP